MPKDKVLHVLAGGIVALVVLLLGLGPITAIGLSLLAGVAKETWDATGRGTVDVWDVVFTVLGSILVVGFWVCLALAVPSICFAIL